MCAQVNGAAEESLPNSSALAVKASAMLNLQDFSAAELPDSSRAAYQAVSVLMQYIMSLQPETSSPVAGTHDLGTHAGKLDWRSEGLRICTIAQHLQIMRQAPARVSS